MTSNKPNRAGELISHLTMGVLGLAMLYAGYRCLRITWRIWREGFAGRGIALPGIIGIVLFLLGGLLCIAAIVPVSKLEKLFSPPKASLGEPPDGSGTGLWFMHWW